MSVGLKEYLQASDILTEAPASKKKITKAGKEYRKGRK